MKEHLEEAIHNFRAGRGRYAKNERYYAGDHDLAFATDKFQTTFGSLFREFALNLCPAICDAVRDKLKITGFSVDDGGTDGEAEAVKRAARRIWHENKMTLRAGEVHKEALKNGDAYVIVWPAADGSAAIFPNRAASCAVVYDEESPGQIVRAAKHWRTPDKRTRVNLFYPDRIEKFITARPGDSSMPDAKEFVPFGETNEDRSVIPNLYGIVPVFHFANNADTGMPGHSELAAAMPVQDGLNKSVLDMLVAMEYSAFRQRWAAGIEVEIDEASGQPVSPFKFGPGYLWAAPDKDARFGDFHAADLEQFLKVKDSFRIDMASVSGTPLHYFMQNTRGIASGEALRKTETRFSAKVRDRQESFGQVWADVMSFALRASGIAEDARLLTLWEDPAPAGEREMLENILLKKEIGISVEQALTEAGYGALEK